MTNEDAIKWLVNLKNDIGNPHYECLWPYAQPIDEICVILKEQEAVEPEKFMDGLVQRYKCRKCGKHLVYARFAKDNYCSKCGQAVKWE
jgi:ribosomal protein S27AE